MQKKNTQIQRIKIILNDFKRVRSKCAQMSLELGEKIKKYHIYQQIQRQVQAKLNKYNEDMFEDIKNKLIISLTELYELQHEFKYSIQRGKYRKICRKKSLQNPINTDRSLESGFSAKFNDSKIKIKEIQLPFYVIKDESAQKKLDLISKFTASLKKSMRVQSQGAQHLKINQFLISQPKYVKMKEKYERMKMRQQQLGVLVEKKVEQEIKKYLGRCEVMEQNLFYTTYRVKKCQSGIQQSSKQIQIYDTKSEGQQETIPIDYHLLRQSGIKVQSLSIQNKLNFRIMKQNLNEDFYRIKKQIRSQREMLYNFLGDDEDTISQQQNNQY